MSGSSRISTDGLVQQAARDRELLPHAARQLAGQRLPLLDAAPARRAAARCARVASAHAVQAADEAQVLLHREVLEELRLVGDEREARLRAIGRAWRCRARRSRIVPLRRGR